MKSPHPTQIEASQLIADLSLRAEYLLACTIEQETGNREPLNRFQRRYAQYLMDNAK